MHSPVILEPDLPGAARESDHDPVGLLSEQAGHELFGPGCLQGLGDLRRRPRLSDFPDDPTAGLGRADGDKGLRTIAHRAQDAECVKKTSPPQLAHTDDGDAHRRLGLRGWFGHHGTPGQGHQATALHTAAIIRSWVDASRYGCIGKLMTRAEAAMLAGKSDGAWPRPANAVWMCSGLG